MLMIYFYFQRKVPRNLFNRFKKLYVPLNCYLASCFEVFNKPKTLQYNSSKEIKLHLTFFNKQIKQ